MALEKTEKKTAPLSESKIQKSQKDRLENAQSVGKTKINPSALSI